MSYTCNDCLSIVDMLVIFLYQVGVLHCEVVMWKLTDLVGEKDVIFTHCMVLCVRQIAATSHVIYLRPNLIFGIEF